LTSSGQNVIEELEAIPTKDRARTAAKITALARNPRRSNQGVIRARQAQHLEILVIRQEIDTALPNQRRRVLARHMRRQKLEHLVLGQGLGSE